MAYTPGTAQITTAVTNTQVGSTYTGLGAPAGVSVLANFTYGSGGTNATVYVQTSYDGGSTWWDVQCFQFTTASAVRYQSSRLDIGVLTPATPTVGALTANTAINGLLGDQLRFMMTTTGTYAGNTSISLTPNFSY